MKRTGKQIVLVALFLAVAAGAGFAANASAAVRATIGSLVLGKPLRFKNLTIIPISTLSISTAIPVATLDEALKKGWLRIREIDDGEVPRLALDNRSGRTIFVMGGEIVTGGKQDRLIGSDALIRPYARGTKIPVYCVEAGRWTETTSQFSTKKNLGTWALRSNAQAGAPAAQENIWGEVDKVQDRAGARSATGAYQDIYEDRSLNERLLALEAGLKNMPRLAAGTVGAICAVGGRILSMDAFADPSVFERLWPKILRASALSAVTAAADESSGETTRESAWQFVERLSDLRFSESRGVDLGVVLRSDSGSTTASALVHDGVVLHLSGFPVAETDRAWQQAPGFAPGLDDDDSRQGRE
ncbi:MAG: hypothetical protein NT005_07690 [Spirochaetes bacterium]|nr:hypothetical protein [Spirochaetota bacterium]